MYPQSVKLTRAFTAQLEALNRHRGKGQQKMTVEHVHIHDGGQAVIGSVTKGQGGVMMKIEDQPHEHPIFVGWTRCGAKTNGGGQCLRIGNRKNGRCRLHGGNSPGAPTGNTNALKHGRYSQEAILKKKFISKILRDSRSTLREFK